MSADELHALWLSLRVALISVTLSTPLALALASLMTGPHWRGKWLIDGLILLPMALPPAVLGFVLASGLGDDGALGGWLHDAMGWHLRFYPTGAILVASMMALPLMVRVLRPALEAADPMLLPVARTLGATHRRGWWTVTLPMLWPAVVSAMALGLAAAWGESGATLVMATLLPQQQPASGHTTAPVAMVQALQQQADGANSVMQATHLAWVSLGVALGAVLLSEWGRRRWHRPAQVPDTP